MSEKAATDKPRPRGEGGDALHISRKIATAGLVAILTVAAFLRLVSFDASPPGLNQDEAANAWNAYCLLKTGADQSGQPWPIFYSRGLGGQRTTLYYYLMLPFQAVGGLNVWTTRLPSAVAGILTVLLIYFVGARLFSRTVGLFAAGLLAISPWQIQQSRWGHEAGPAAFLVILPIAFLLWSNVPINSDDKRRPNIAFAFLAGAAGGVACYGYHALRLFMPVFFLGLLAVTWRGWWKSLKTLRGLAAIAAFLIALSATFGPLAWKHKTDPDISKRGETTWVWEDSDNTTTKITKVLGRYACHFAPDFLFIQGDHFPIQSPPGMGQLHWYMLPLMLIGAGVLIRRFRSSAAGRIVLVWVVLYPIGDAVSRHVIGGQSSMHALRSLPGLCGLMLLAAVGAGSAAEYLAKRARQLAVPAAVAVGIVVMALNARFFYNFYGDYNTRPNIYHRYHADLLEACKWLRPRFDKVDAVFCTTTYMNQPYVVTLVGLRYDPNSWFGQPREFYTPGDWDICTRYGKMHFLYGDLAKASIERLQNNGQRDRVIFVVRPDELVGGEPDYVIRRPDGAGVLWIFDRHI